MDKESKNSKYLFVNKDATSRNLTRSDAQETSDIIKHVQGRRHRGHKKASNADPWMAFVSSIPLRGETTDSTDKEGEAGSSKSSVEEGASGGQSLLQAQPHLSSNASDPLHYTAAGDQWQLHDLLQQGLNFTENTTFFAEAFAPPPSKRQNAAMRHAKAVLERLKKCVDNEMLMYSTLAYCSSSLSWMSGWTSGVNSPRHFIVRALPAIRSALEEAQDLENPWLLLSVCSLAMTELWTAVPELWRNRTPPHSEEEKLGIETSRMHLSALVSLIEQAGGLLQMEPYVLESTILAGKYLAIYEMKRPLVPLDFDPGPTPIDGSFDAPPDHERVVHLGDELMRTPMPTEMLRTVRGIIDYIKVAHVAWRSPIISEKNECWLFLRLQALTYQLLYMDDLKGIENSIRLAMLVFLLDNTEYIGSRVAASALLKHFKSAIEDVLDELECYQDSLLFWWLCSGAMTSEPCPEKEWFLNNLVRVSVAMDLQPVATVFRAQLENYLFLEHRQGSRLSDLAFEVSRRREDITGLSPPM